MALAGREERAIRPGVHDLHGCSVQTRSRAESVARCVQPTSQLSREGHARRRGLRTPPSLSYAESSRNVMRSVLEHGHCIQRRFLGAIDQLEDIPVGYAQHRGNLVIDLLIGFIYAWVTLAN